MPVSPTAESLVTLIQDVPLVSAEAGQVRAALSAWDLNAGEGDGPSYFYEFERLLAAAVFAPAFRDVSAVAGCLAALASRGAGSIRPAAGAAILSPPSRTALSAPSGHFAARPEARTTAGIGRFSTRRPSPTRWGRSFFLRPLFERGPLGVRGGNACLLDTGFAPQDGFRTTRLAAYKMILDFSSFSVSLLVYPGGQSGHPLSPAYDDQLGAYVSQKYFKLEEPGRRRHRLRLLAPARGAGAL